MLAPLAPGAVVAASYSREVSGVGSWVLGFRHSVLAMMDCWRQGPEHPKPNTSHPFHRSSVIAGSGERNMKRPRWLNEFTNTVLVQLFKHLPWLAERWARGHRFVEGQGIPWAPLGKPLRDSCIAMVTTAGVHLTSQPPFDMEDPDGDATFRAFPAAADKSDLTITHKYYDHSAADRDINVV